MRKIISILLVTLLSKVSISQTNNVKGVITDNKTNLAIENATVIDINANKIVLSNANGVFEFKKIIANTILEISCIGYETKKISTTNNANNILRIQLQKTELTLNNITVKTNSINNYNKIAAIDIKLRPINTAQDVLKIVPGLFIAQHAGGGKAEQIFLRGFDIDHGTDISITVDGMPVNMISHAHGQGYADLHFLNPETIDKVNFDKGPYNAEKGNLSTAGFVDFKTKDFLENNTFKKEIDRKSVV